MSSVSRVVIHVIPEAGATGDPQDLVFDDKDVIRIGRSVENDVVLQDDMVSRHHAQLATRPGRLILTDLQSGNGVFVNGRKIAGPVILKEAVAVKVGHHRLEIELVE